MVTPITAISGVSKRRAESLRDAQLGTIPELAAASPEVVRDVLADAGHRVSRSTVERWLVEARAIEAEEWHRAASFVVSFETRGEDGERERRTVVEQTEVDTGPAPTHQWRGWECSQVCEWMLDRVPPGPDQSIAEPAATAAAALAPAEAPAPPVAAPGTGPPHRIERAELVEGRGERSLIVEDGRGLDVGGVRDVTRVTVKVGPGGPGSTSVALRFRDRETGVRFVAGPAEVHPDDHADLDTPSVPPGAYDVEIVAWDEYAQAAPGHVPLVLIVGSSVRGV